MKPHSNFKSFGWATASHSFTLLLGLVLDWLEIQLCAMSVDGFFLSCKCIFWFQHFFTVRIEHIKICKYRYLKSRLFCEVWRLFFFKTTPWYHNNELRGLRWVVCNNPGWVSWGYIPFSSNRCWCVLKLHLCWPTVIKRVCQIFISSLVSVCIHSKLWHFWVDCIFL